MKRSNNIQYNYFKNIDTEYKAYILGFIYADGSIIKRQGREDNLVISIQEEDGYILEKLLKEVNNNELLVRNPPSTIKNNWKKQVTCRISSTEICNDLQLLGCFQNKTVKGMVFPNISYDLIPHFIRGFFDGDGCINIKKEIYKGKRKTTINYSKRLAFTSTDNQFLDRVLSYLPVSKVYKRVVKRTLLVWTYWIERQGDVEKVKDYLYKDANYFLKRKRDKFYMTIKSEALDTSKERLETT
jgi:hypothetical protein